jgi:hypothetical protein
LETGKERGMNERKKGKGRRVQQQRRFGEERKDF